MSEIWGYKFGVLIGLLIIGAATGTLVALFRYLVWWPTLLLQSPYRPGIVFSRLFVVLILAAAVPLLLLPRGLDVGTMILLWMTVVPGLTEQWARRAAWKRNSSEDRADAAAIRQSILARRGEERTISADKPWPEYIVDAARLQRRRRYRPPGH
jgi:hypothetical protein